VHSTKELSPASFAIRVGGETADLEAVFPGFSDRDRLGVVVRRPLGGAGASLLILAAVTGFYDVQRRRGEPFFLYPDYFVVHAGRTLGDHRKLEIWPPQKEVVVEADAEPLLRAVNGRGVTRLAVEDGTPAAPAILPETLASARPHHHLPGLRGGRARPRRRGGDRRQRGDGALPGGDARPLRRLARRGRPRHAAGPPRPCRARPARRDLSRHRAR
jgi:hypothetical protein